MAAGADLTLAEFLDAHYLIEKQLRDGSIHQLRTTLHRLDRWHGGAVSLRQLSREFLNQFLAAQSEKLAPKTVNRQRNDILCLWRLAAELELIGDPPRRIRRAKQPRRLPEAWSQEQLGKIIEMAERQERYYPTGIRIGAWWGLFLRLGYDTGLRRSDLLDLDVDQVREERFEVFQAKTQMAIVCQASPGTLAALEATIPPARQRALPWPYSDEVFYSHWRKYVLRPAGWPESRKDGPQKLRRTSATHLEAAHPGASMAHLGHLTPGLAYKNYVDPRLVQLQRPLPPALDSDKE